MKISRLYLDSNIIIRIFEGKDDIAAVLMQLLEKSFRADGPFLLTSDLAFAEALVLPFREGDQDLVQTYTTWGAAYSLIEVTTLSRDIIYASARLRADYKSLKMPDAIHLASAIQHGCDTFLTADERLASQYSLRIDPAIQGHRSASLTVVHPTLDVLSRIIGTLA